MGQSEGKATEALGVREELWCYHRKIGAGEDVSRGKRWLRGVVKVSPATQWRRDHRRQEWNQEDSWAEFQRLNALSLPFYFVFFSTSTHVESFL